MCKVSAIFSQGDGAPVLVSQAIIIARLGCIKNDYDLGGLFAGLLFTCESTGNVCRKHFVFGGTQFTFRRYVALPAVACRQPGNKR